MDVRLTDDQRLLQDTAARLADELATTNADQLRTRSKDPWTSLVDLGLPALCSPELSGVDASGVEMALVVEEFGRTLSVAPVVGQAALVPALLHAAGATALLAQVAAGDLRLAPALREDCLGMATLGASAVAFDALGATHALILDDSGSDRRLAAVALISSDLEALDLTRTLVNVAPGSRSVDLGVLGGTISDERWSGFEALTLTMFAADLVGVMRGALADAVGYVADRQQFGVPVGTFQAVQHIAADALVDLEGARSCCWHAAWTLDHRGPAEALLAARTAKAYASRAGVAVVEATVQLFGGISITWEHLSHLRLRRTLLDRQAWGDERLQFSEVARLRIADPGLV